MLLGMVLAAQAATAPMDFRQAKARADAYENGLSASRHAALRDKQGKALKAAVAACARPNPDVSAFTVVLLLNPDGSVKSSWLKGGTALARCVRGQLAAAGLHGHWPSPFYISFEVSFTKG